jgi:IS5 family transposase
MALGLAPRQADLFRSTAYCEGRVAPDSIYGILHRESFALFPDEMFADLFDDAGRRSVPPMIVAVVMVLQRIEGCSDREAADPFAFDARWKYAAGGLDFDYPGFVHTVLVDMRARLAGSARPDRIFELIVEVARAAGLVGQQLDPVLAQAGELLASVTGQDLDQDASGVFKIARRVALDRVISTVDPDARHWHKTSARGFDGYKGHIAIDPDSEIITATQATAGNSGDAEVAESLLAGDQDSATSPSGGRAVAAGGGEDPPAVYGDAAYGSGELIERLDDASVSNGIKCQPSAAVKGCVAKDRFTIDLDSKTVTCPAGVTVPIRAATGRHGGTARFAAACRTCPLAAQCTTAKEGRTITIGPHEARLAAARTRQQDPAWKADYRAARPKVERKIAHLMRRRHGGRRARVRGLLKVAAHFALLAAAVNLARLAVLGVACQNGTWAAAGS